MFYLYILVSRKTGRYYVGSTKDLGKRLREHNAGKSLSTRAGAPWNLVHSEAYQTRAEAIREEIGIKARGIGRYLADLQLANSR